MPNKAINGFQRRLVFVRRLYHVQDRWRTPGPHDGLKQLKLKTV